MIKEGEKPHILVPRSHQLHTIIPHLLQIPTSTRALSDTPLRVDRLHHGVSTPLLPLLVWQDTGHYDHHLLLRRFPPFRYVPQYAPPRQKWRMMRVLGQAWRGFVIDQTAYIVQAMTRE